MMSGKLNRKVKETIAVLVSKDLRTIAADLGHSTHLVIAGNRRIARRIFAIHEDFKKAYFFSKGKALITLTRKANISPLGISDEEFKRVRDADASDAELLEALEIHVDHYAPLPAQGYFVYASTK